MVKAKLCDSVSVLDRFSKVRFELCSFNYPYSFEGTVTEFTKSRLYQTYACDCICELQILGSCLKGCTALIKLVPPID